MIEKIKAWWRGDNLSGSISIDLYNLPMVLFWGIGGGVWVGRGATLLFDGDPIGWVGVIGALFYFAIMARGIHKWMIVNTKSEALWWKQLRWEEDYSSKKVREVASASSLEINRLLAEVQTKDATIAALQRELESRPPASTV